MRSAPTPSSANPRIVESPPTKKRSLAGRSSTVRKTSSTGAPASVCQLHLAGKTVREPEADAGGEDHATGAGQTAKEQRLRVGLDEANLAAERACRQAPFAAEDMPRVGSTGSSRVSIVTADENAETRTCGKMRSIAALSSSADSGTNARSKVFVVASVYLIVDTHVVPPRDRMADVGRHALRAKLKLDRTPCSISAVIRMSLPRPNGFGSR